VLLVKVATAAVAVVVALELLLEETVVGEEDAEAVVDAAEVVADEMYWF
jgi:hypothetical protein